MSLFHFAAGLAVACAAMPALAVPYAEARIDFAAVTFGLEDITPEHETFGLSYWPPTMSADACIRPGEAAICGAPGTPSITGGGGPAYVPKTHVTTALADGTTGTATFSTPGLRSELSGTGATGPKGVNANWYNTLTFIGTGRVWIEADYHVEAGGIDGASWRETLAWVGIILFPTNAAQYQVEALAVAPGLGAVERDGRLRISYDFHDGEQLGVFMQAHTHRLGLAAPVPEPATLALMLGGLAVLGVARSRRG